MKSLYVQYIYIKLLVWFILSITTFHFITAELCLTEGAAMSEFSHFNYLYNYL